MASIKYKNNLIDSIYDKDYEFPQMVGVGISYVCNADCIHCPYSKYKKAQDIVGREKFIDKNTFCKIVDECVNYNTMIRITGGGEPLLHPNVLELIGYAKRRNVRVALTTNGSLLDEDCIKELLDSNIDAIEISVDAHNKEVYEKIRIGLHFEQIKDNVFNLVRMRNELFKKTSILVSIINQKLIRKDLQDAVKFWEKIVDKVIIRKFIEITLTKESDKKKNTNIICPYPFQRIYIDSSGTVRFCCYDIFGETYMGNIKDDSLLNIWRSEKFNLWRSYLINGDYEKIEICKKCNNIPYYSWNYNFFHALGDALKNRGEKHERTVIL